MLIIRTMLVNSPLAPAPKLARARPEPRPDPEDDDDDPILKWHCPIVVQSFVTQSFPPEARPSLPELAPSLAPGWPEAREFVPKPADLEPRTSLAPNRRQNLARDARGSP